MLSTRKSGWEKIKSNQKKKLQLDAQLYSASVYDGIRNCECELDGTTVGRQFKPSPNVSACFHSVCASLPRKHVSKHILLKLSIISNN